MLSSRNRIIHVIHLGSSLVEFPVYPVSLELLMSLALLELQVYLVFLDVRQYLRGTKKNHDDFIQITKCSPTHSFVVRKKK